MKQEVVELRQYTLHRGARDTLIDIFEREFIEPQEAAGMSILGTFRDIDDPDRFVWLRGFSDMETRKDGLTAFYGGPVWREHKAAANATMIDSDNVLLLKPARETSRFAFDDAANGCYAATICTFEEPVETRFADFFETQIAPDIRSHGTTVEAYFVSEHRPNTFPALPVRERDNAFVWFSALRNPNEYDESWRERLTAFAPLISGIKILKLAPTRRSVLR